MRKLAQLIIVLATLTWVASADSYRFYSNRSSMGGQDTIHWNQFGPPGTGVYTLVTGTTANGYSFNFNEFGDFNAITAQQGVNWNGNFNPGDSLIWTGPVFTQPGAFHIIFSHPVTAFGFQIQADLFGPFNATVLINPVAGGTDSLTFSGFSSPAGDGSALFIGIGDLSGPISDIVIYTTSGSPLWDGDFAINDVTLRYSPVIPEPSTLVLLGSAMLGSAATLRRRLLGS